MNLHAACTYKGTRALMASSLDTLVTNLRSGAISRRHFMQGATALGVSASAAGMLARSAGAQDATPDATPEAEPVLEGGEPIVSMTYDEYIAQLEEHFGFEEAASEGGQLIYVEGSDIQTLNPQLSTDVYSGIFARHMFHTLTRPSIIDGEQVPFLADSFELAADGVTYTFFLPPEAQWHDGTPITAEDVIFSIDGLLDEGSLNPRQTVVAAALADYRAVDEHTVELVAPGPLAAFLDDVPYNIHVVPRHIWEGVAPVDWGNDPGATGQDPARVVGSGPMRFVEWIPNDHVTMAAVDDYWRPIEAYHIDEFIYRTVGEQTSAINSVQTGEADVCRVEFSQVESLRTSNPELQVVDYDINAMYYYYMNLDEERTPLFQDVRTRQALLHALDRDLIVETVFQGFATTATGTQSPLSRAYAPDRVETIYDFNPDRARELLADAGWEDVDGDGVLESPDGDRLSFSILYTESSAIWDQQIPYMQQAWGEIGVDMVPNAIPFPALTELAMNGDFEMVLSGYFWPENPDQGTMFRCGGGGYNYTDYCNEEYDRLNDESRRELDADRRLELIIDQSNIINEEQPIGIVVFRQAVSAATPRVHNFIPHSDSTFWGMKWMWVEG